ncbi:MAG: hypothetical protein Phog2KO_15450 [Phototrophicaceae bacterium]
MLVLSATPTATIQATATGFTGLIPTQITAQVSPTSRASLTPSPTNEPVLLFNNNTNIEHRVQTGETLNSIANLYGLPLNHILSANGMRLSDVLFIGQTLTIPLPVPTATPTATLDFTNQASLIDDFFQSQRPTALPNTVNTLAYDDFLTLSDSVADNIRDIFNHGQTLGRDPQVFTRIGDSTIEAPHFFFRFDDEPYHLGNYTYLQRTIDYYSGSFNHDSMAVMRGLHTWSVFDPMWSPSECETGEHMLACEFRLYNPSIIFIRLGTNDRGQEELTRDNFEDIIAYCIDNGVIPILGTKADRFDGDNSTNAIIRDLAQVYDLPLWDFDLLAQALPNHGLTNDDVHLTFFYEHDWRLARGFTTGHGLHNLTGLIVLDEIRQVLSNE